MMDVNPQERFWELLREVNSLLAERRDAEATSKICEACNILCEQQPEYGDWGNEKFDLIMVLSDHHKRRLVN
jgi:hypothetical protein